MRAAWAQQAFPRASVAGLRLGRNGLQFESAQGREEPQCGYAGSGGDERGGRGGREHQERLGRLGDHHDRQAGRQQQEDCCPQPGRTLEEAVQARVMGAWLPQRDYLGGQPGNERVRAARGPGLSHRYPRWAPPVARRGSAG